MKKTIFKGAAVAIVTPMHEDGSVNYESFGNLIDFQIENGSDAIVICGTTGESATLSDEEHVQVVDYAIKRINGRVPAIAGTGSNDTNYAVHLSQEAEQIGADALLVVTPYYNKTSQKGLISHFTHIADRVNTPIILYNVPSRTGVDIKPETYFELCKHPNIVATKEANGDVAALARTIHYCGDNLDIYSGNDDQIVPFLSLGAKGVISVISNIAPKATHEICDSFFRGDVQKSASLQIKYIELIKKLFSDVNPIPVKEALNLMGFQVGGCRLPLVSMSEKGTNGLRECLEKFSLI